MAKTDDEDVQGWYAVSAWAPRMMTACAELVGLGLTYYVPAETVERRVGRRLRSVSRPVWPGYVFVFCAPRDFARLRGVEGVHDFVRVDGAPVKLAPNALVPVLLAEIFGDLDYTKKGKEYKPQRGDRVKVRSGKWKGYLGRILSVAKRKALVETKWCKLEIEAEHLELEAAKKAAA